MDQKRPARTHQREHKTLALKGFQHKDIEAVLTGAAFCQKELHEK